MKVGIVYEHALGGGGYPRDIRWLAGALAMHGVGVTIFTDRDVQGSIKDGLSEEVKIVPLQDLSSETADAYHVFGMFLPKQVWVLKRFLLGKPVIVSPMGHLMPYHLCRRRLRKAMYLRLIKPIFKKAPWFHAFSNVERTSIREFLGAEVKIFEAGLGIFPPPIDEASKDNDTHNLTKLLFFGRNDIYQKGIDVLLEGAALALRRGANLSLIIAGRPWKNSREYVKKFVENHRLGKRIEILGPVDESMKWKLLANADYLVFLSRWDGPPRPIREAIAVGTPIIVSPETNMGDLVAEFNAGKIVELDPHLVAQTFLEVNEARHLWHEHREGVRRLRERLSWDRVAEDYLRGYKQVLESLE